MDHSGLTLTNWRSRDAVGARRLAEEVADQVGARLVAFEGAEHGGSGLHRAVIEREGAQFALVPGGQSFVGFDVERWAPSVELLASYREQSLEGGFAFPADPRDLLGEVLEPRRAATLPALLVAVESELLTTPVDQTPKALAARGLRMPSPDEWEHACGGGVHSLWWWAPQCPLDRSPYGYSDGPQHQPNPFGLHIAHSVYDAEVTSDTTVVKGGDGGEAVCGGYGGFVEWLPLATANRNPSMAEFIHGPGGEDMYEDFSVRPVIEL